MFILLKHKPLSSKIRENDHFAVVFFPFTVLPVNEWMDGCCLSLELSLSLMEFPHLETYACILKIPKDHLRDTSKRSFANAKFAFRIFELSHARVFSHEPPFSCASV